MGRHARELLQSRRLIGDGLRVELHERFDGRLHQHVDGLVYAGDDERGFDWRRADACPLDLMAHERDENATEQLILAQDLMERGLLSVPKRPELPGFSQDG